jgi:hypothetical protein
MLVCYPRYYRDIWESVRTLTELLSPLRHRSLVQFKSRHVLSVCGCLIIVKTYLRLFGIFCQKVAICNCLISKRWSLGEKDQVFPPKSCLNSKSQPNPLQTTGSPFVSGSPQSSDNGNLINGIIYCLNCKSRSSHGHGTMEPLRIVLRTSE